MIAKPLWSVVTAIVFAVTLVPLLIVWVVVVPATCIILYYLKER